MLQSAITDSDPVYLKHVLKNSLEKRVIEFMFVLSSGQLLCLRWEIQSCDFNLCRVALITDIFRVTLSAVRWT